MTYQPQKLTQQEINENTLECDGELYLFDENHSGMLYLTEECVNKYNLCKEYDVELIEWDEWSEEHSKELKDKGFKWEYYVSQFTEVYDLEGNYLRNCVYEEWEVCKVNGIPLEILTDEGCEIIGWCDG